MKADHFRDKTITTGTWISTGSPTVADIASQYPFDWLLLDFEHGSTHEAALPDILRTVASEKMTVIVRVPAPDPVLIGRVLDWGADGIMVPHVRSAAEAAQCVAATRYPPHGTRGYSSSVRAYGYGTNVPAAPSQVRPLVFAQIEDADGLGNSHAIAATAGVDVLFVGPADLRLALTTSTGPDIPSFDIALNEVVRATKAHGKQAGILLRDHHQIDTMRQMGYQCLAIDSDIGILRNGYAMLMDKLRATRRS
jgi:2-keto-3-deoxy-L-rhamnonate aldolase RhmA